jgi:hypothetical protein
MSELYNRKTDYTFTGGDAFLVQQGPLPLLKKKKKTLRLTSFQTFLMSWPHHIFLVFLSGRKCKIKSVRLCVRRKKKKFTVFTPYFYGQPTTCVGNFEWEMKKKKRINRVVEVEAKSAWENETEKR